MQTQAQESSVGRPHRCPPLLRLAGAAGLLGVACMAAAAAQPHAVALDRQAVYLLPVQRLPAASAATAIHLRAAGSELAGPSDDTLDETRPRSVFSSARSSLASARLVEMPTESIPGRYSRPKYALGFRSEKMRNWANSMGFDASDCLAPLVRARLTLSQQGDAGARLMVFARCSLR
jgi:hypothetical protein